MNELTFLVLMSKVPVYLYVIYRAIKYRHSLVIISANWLGALAFMGAISSIAVATSNKTYSGLIAYGVVFCLFMLAFTAKEIRRK
jgi:hypothetical protein